MSLPFDDFQKMLDGLRSKAEHHIDKAKGIDGKLTELAPDIDPTKRKIVALGLAFFMPDQSKR